VVLPLGDFIRRLPTSATDQATVKAIVDIAHALGKHTIAEAAGDQATLDHLRDLGVDYAQGYHIAMPAPARAAARRAA
jgi:EAL domain-containing protein (putative c-di-GMP-specific phosphodiesterase class I)